MSADKVTPNDARMLHQYAMLNGRKYHYLLSLPKDQQFKATVFLIHGWPDISFGWRYQLPLLTSMGLRVVAMDMMGYGQTDAPQVPPESIHLYGYKRAADDIVALAKQLEAPRIILGGHDWGGMIVYRAAQWHPDVITHVFSVCTPFFPARDTLFTTQDLVTGPVPQFGYQLQLAGPEVEEGVQTGEQIAQFLKGMYGGRTHSGEPFFRPETGVDLSQMEEVGMTPLLNERELEYYVEQYANGLHGTLNWYRTREANFEDEKKLGLKTIDQPTLFIQAANDSILTPKLASGMEAYISKLSRREVKSGHWALWQAADQVNAHLKDWLDGVVFGGKSTL